MPWIEQSDQDGLRMIEYCRERVKDLGCPECKPSDWDPDSANKTDWPCHSPTIASVRINPYGKREIQSRQCSRYREWAEARKKRNNSGPKTYDDGPKNYRRRN